MPSREELISSIVGCLSAPAAMSLAIGAPASNIASIVSTVEEGNYGGCGGRTACVTFHTLERNLERRT